MNKQTFCFVMKNFKACPLTVSIGMAFAIMMVAPALMGAFSQQETAFTVQKACAIPVPTTDVLDGFQNGSCCEKMRSVE